MTTKIRIGLSARVTGFIEKELESAEEQDFLDDPNRFVERRAEDWFNDLLEEGHPIDPDVDDLDVFNEKTGKWEVVPED